jgi:hypothetical protein
MNKYIGIALLIGGIVLLVYGFKAKDSVESKLSQTFTGTPSDNTKWLLAGGAVCCVAGVGLLFFKGK